MDKLIKSIKSIFARKEESANLAVVLPAPPAPVIESMETTVGSAVSGPVVVSNQGVAENNKKGEVFMSKQQEVLLAALKEFGQAEIPGEKNNPRILQYHSHTTLNSKNEEESWCSSFANFAVAQAGLVGTKSAAARSWLQWGKATDTPSQGCIVVFWRESPDSWKGHVALYVAETPTHILVLGGNQNNEVNISKYPKTQLLGYRVY